jgi:hypothetical protein
MTTMAWDLIDKALKNSQRMHEGQHTLEIEHLELGESRSGVKMVKGKYRVVSNPHTGQSGYFDYYIGTKADPEAEDPKTQADSRGLRDLVAILTASKVERQRELEKMLPTAKGKRFVAKVVHQVEPETMKDGTPNPWAGSIRAVLRNVQAIQAVSNGTEPVSSPVSKAKSKQPTGILCPVCKERVAPSDYHTHQEAHEEAGEEES